ncbi:hypothetical protein TNCV_4603761 [Trichonephila clavipes]|nr:hypothetical protein TNCV_4603761 [Trichonephila clavipes]
MVPIRPPFSSLFLQPRIIDLRSLNPDLHNNLRYRGVESDLRVSLVNKGYRGVESDLRVSLVNKVLDGPYPATVLVALSSAPDHRPPVAESLIFTIISGTGVLRVTYVSLVNKGLDRPYSATVLVALFLQTRIINLRLLNPDFYNNLRYRGVESDLRVSLVNKVLDGPYPATVLVALSSAPDHRPPLAES